MVSICLRVRRCCEWTDQCLLCWMLLDLFPPSPERADVFQVSFAKIEAAKPMPTASEIYCGVSVLGLIWPFMLRSCGKMLGVPGAVGKGSSKDASDYRGGCRIEITTGNIRHCAIRTVILNAAKQTSKASFSFLHTKQISPLTRSSDNDEATINLPRRCNSNIWFHSSRRDCKE